jgi:carboxymethylenebutenolidase
MMKLRVLAVAAAAVAVMAAVHGRATGAARSTVVGLPSPENAQAVLTASLTRHHPEWVDVPAGRSNIQAFVVYPERATAAPVVLVTASNQGMSDWMRAVGSQVAAEGYIAVVPERLTSEVRAYAATMPGSNGNSVTLGFNFSGTGSLDVALDSPSAETHVASFELGEHAWHSALAYMSRADASPANALGAGSAVNQEREGRGRGREGRGEGGGNNCGMNCKAPNLPATFLMAATTVAHSPRKGEWTDIPWGSGKLHTWISYPDGTGKAPVIVVIHPGPGMDAGEPPTPGGGANWIRAIADQMAMEGFIALAPDFTSGLGPNGGNFDSFKYPDEVGRAMGKRTPADQVSIVRTTRDYGLKLPRANGKSSTIGFCFGGGMSWISAAEVPGLNAAVVFYGAPPPDVQMAKIGAPVIAFYGENDLGLAPRIQPGTDAMKRLNKQFEVHVYEKATHAFLYRQDLGENMRATQDAWPKAIAFLNKHTKG